MTHSDLVNTCLLLLSRYGFAHKNNTGALRDAQDRLVRYGLKGSADIYSCLSGRFVVVECKVGRDRQRVEQRKYQLAVEAAGGIYILARSEEDVTDRLAAEGLLARRAA